ncbi:cupin domain-containing protein [Sphaerisporangium sp. TRM90804]|uniref:cupin domain-containing protein n=1 Tax=Sphaerisporangium sp. TRM90804 TaxID=3031113 RepID=UPI00244D6EF4|nr:cupin domain-containing protein [Sphaerisporangium sp. TRM90804]MDH2427680.1 cupin domain-containing protein [Sphaerisporangium sp. TRM90804]
MPVIRHQQNRRTETPNAVMTTLASPTQGGATLSVWGVDMRPGQAGPPHAFDVDQVWTVLSGGATVELGGETFTVGPGDTVVMPADARRRLRSDPQTGLGAIVAAPAGGRAYAVAGPIDVAPECAVRDGDKLVPAWVV